MVGVVTNIQRLICALEKQNYRCETRPDTHDHFLFTITPKDKSEYSIVVCVPYLPAYEEAEREGLHPIAKLLELVGLNVEWNCHGQIIFQDGRFNPCHMIFVDDRRRP